MNWLDYGMKDATLDYAHEVTRRRLERQARVDAQAEGRTRSTRVARVAGWLVSGLRAMADRRGQTVNSRRPLRGHA